MLDGLNKTARSLLSAEMYSQHSTLLLGHCITNRAAYTILDGSYIFVPLILTLTLEKAEFKKKKTLHYVTVSI